MQQKDTVVKLNPQKFNFQFTLSDPTLFTEGFIPGLEKLTPFSVKGMYDSDALNLKLDLDLPQLVYSKIIIDTFKVNINSTPNALNGTIQIAEISNPTIKLENIGFYTQLRNNGFY